MTEVDICRTCGKDRLLDARLRGARARNRMLVNALAAAVTDGLRCECARGGCDSDCRRLTIQRKVAVYIDEAEALQ